MSRNLLRLVNEEPPTPEQGYALLNGTHSAPHQPASARTPERVRPLDNLVDNDRPLTFGTIRAEGKSIHVRPSDARKDGRRMFVVDIHKGGRIIATERLTAKQYSRFLSQLGI